MVDNVSSMQDASPNLNEYIAGRVRNLRAAQALSLEALAEKSGVSRSMISLIERGESSPTAAVLDKLATALDIPLYSLFAAPADDPTQPSGGPLARRADQPEWQDPASGYLRRNVSPLGEPQSMQIVEVNFPPGGRVAFENGGPHVHVQQQVWLLAGEIDVTVGDVRHRLHEGDCLAMKLDRPTMFHNPSGEPARYALVVASEPSSKRS
jgi:transcriptional regulator with XRE-family HTH domain